jgi:hypothetical protein
MVGGDGRSRYRQLAARLSLALRSVLYPAEFVTSSDKREQVPGRPGGSRRQRLVVIGRYKSGPRTASGWEGDRGGGAVSSDARQIMQQLGRRPFLRRLIGRD